MKVSWQRAKLPGMLLRAGFWAALTLSVSSAAESPSAEQSAISAAIAGSVRSVHVLAGDEPLFSAPDRTSKRRGAAAIDAYLPIFAATPGPGCTGRWLSIGPLAWICSERVALSDATPLEPIESPLLYDSGLPLSFYIVAELGARAYKSLLDRDDGVPIAELEPGFIIGIRQIAKKDNEMFGLSNKGLWISLAELRPLKIPTFHGELIQGDGAKLGWANKDRVPVFASPESQVRVATLDRLTPLHLLDQVQHHRTTWLRTGEHSWVRANDVQRSSPTPTPSELLPGERWIDVDIANQVLTAYQGEAPVFATLVSTGKGGNESPLGTPKGHFRIWVKLRTSDMTNLEEEEASRYYAIQDVPWVMYFKEGYGLHAAFWHNSFGHPRSHGCINLAPLDAQRLFHWVTPKLPAGWTAILPMAHDRGTLIVVR